MQKFDIEEQLEKEILEAARIQVNRFNDDYDYRNPTDRQTEKILAAITAKVAEQTATLKALVKIQLDLEKLAKSIG